MPARRGPQARWSRTRPPGRPAVGIASGRSVRAKAVQPRRPPMPPPAEHEANSWRTTPLRPPSPRQSRPSAEIGVESRCSCRAALPMTVDVTRVGPRGACTAETSSLTEGSPERASARHRALGPALSDERSDTVVLRLDATTYGRHAAPTSLVFGGLSLTVPPTPVVGCDVQAPVRHDGQPPLAADNSLAIEALVSVHDLAGSDGSSSGNEKRSGHHDLGTRWWTWLMRADRRSRGHGPVAPLSSSID